MHFVAYHLNTRHLHCTLPFFSRCHPRIADNPFWIISRQNLFESVLSNLFCWYCFIHCSYLVTFVPLRQNGFLECHIYVYFWDLLSSSDVIWKYFSQTLLRFLVFFYILAIYHYFCQVLCDFKMANGWPILLTSLFKTSQNLFLLHWQKGLIALVASHLFQPFQTCLKKLTNQKQRFSPKIARQKKHIEWANQATK